MKLKNKKSKIFALGLAVILIISLTAVIFLVITRIDALVGSATIGSNQIALYNIIQESEKTITYADIGFGLSLQKALYETANKGGYENIPECGNYFSMNLWKNGNQECYPDAKEIKKSISAQTLSMFNNDYANENPYVDVHGNPENNHEIFIENKGNSLIARAYAFLPIKYNIICNYGKLPILTYTTEIAGFEFKYNSYLFADDEKEICGQYMSFPYLKKELKFDMDSFEDASKSAKAFADDVDNCIAEDKTARVCVFEKLNTHKKISRDCFGGVKEVFDSFVNTYTTNLESDTEDCTFFYSPPQIIDIDEDIVYRIRVVSRGEKTEIDLQSSSLEYQILFGADYNFEYMFDTKGPYLAEYYDDSDNPYVIEGEIQYVISYAENGKLENQEINYGEGELLSADWNLPGNIMFYKEKKGKVVFVDSDNYDEFMSVKNCAPQKENTFSFCYDTEEKVLAYDDETTALTMQPVKIMFGMGFENKISFKEEPQEDDSSLIIDEPET